MRKLSKKRAKQYRDYSKVRKEFLLENPYCQARIPGCTIEATDVHHKKGKIEGLLTDTNNFVAICRSCHSWVEEHPAKAKEMGLSKSRLAI